MTLYSYHVSQEQFDPRELLDLVRHAEAAGFDAAFSSDHLQPWAPQQGHSAFTWAWLGAALQATQRLNFGTITVPGGWRYQPVVLAQAVATLACMYPGRLPWIALGSGQAMNEAVAGGDWPVKAERNRRLFEGARAMRALLDGERVSIEGPPAVADGRLWCVPPQRPRLVGAALSEDTARWMGGWAEGLLTTAADLATVRRIVTAFHEGGGGDRPVHVKLNISWAPSDAEAVRQAWDQWRFNGAPDTAEVRQPEGFDAATRRFTHDDIRRQVFVSHELEAHVRHLQACVSLGVASIDLHNVGLNQREFLDAFGREVLPALRVAGRAHPTNSQGR